MAEETDYDPTKPEITGLQNGDVNNVTDNSIKSTTMEKQRERLEEQGKDLHEQGKDLEEIEFREGGSRSRGGGAFVIGSNHKFPLVRSRYLSGPIGSCHDSCKFGHRHREPEKNTTRPRPLWGTIRESRPLARTGSDNMVGVLSEGTKTKRDDQKRLSLPGPTKVEKNYCVRELNISKFKRVQSEVKPIRYESEMGKKKIMGRRSSLVENTTPKVKEVKPEPMKMVSRRSSLEENTAPKVKEVKPEPELKKIVSRRSSLVENTAPKVKEVKPELKKIVSRSLSLVENTAPKVKEVKPEPKEMMSRRSSLVENTAPKVKEVKPEPKKEKAKEPMNGSISQPTPMRKSSSIKATIYKKVRNVSRSKKETVPNEASKVEPRIDTKSVKKVPNEASASTTTTRRSQVGQNKDSKGDQTSSPGGLSSSLSTSQHTPNPKRRGSTIEYKGASSAWKVKFKRGTVVALQGSNNTPRKLKFKQGKFSNNDDGLENAKNGIVCELKRGNNSTGDEHNGEKFEPSKVQLRHQEESGKKKDNVDLNNVIEETATKLVKMRKSKVKALVGAFESVMYIRGDSPMEAGVL